MPEAPLVWPAPSPGAEGSADRRESPARPERGLTAADSLPPPAIRAAGTRAAGRSGRARLSPGLVLLGAIVALAILAPLFGDPYSIDLSRALEPPSLEHWLGTDEAGRDLLARLLHGARVSLGIGLAGAALAVVVGAVLGLIAGYRGGWLDAVLMRLVDLGLAIPSIFAILLFTALFTSGPGQLVLLIGLTGWMPVARLTRGSVREILQAPFVESALALGAGGWRIMVRHCLPNTLGVLFVVTLIQVNRAILAETTISFLGLGIKPPTPSWGNLLMDAQNQLWTAPWLGLAPGLAITLTLLAVYSLGADRARLPR
jgi:peptide/nickel transport system permease protein